MVVQLGRWSAKTLREKKASSLEPPERLRTWASASCCLLFLNSPRPSLCVASVTEPYFLMFCEAQACVTFGDCQLLPSHPHTGSGRSEALRNSNQLHVIKPQWKSWPELLGWAQLCLELARCYQNPGN